MARMTDDESCHYKREKRADCPGRSCQLAAVVVGCAITTVVSHGMTLGRTTERFPDSSANEGRIVACPGGYE